MFWPPVVCSTTCELALCVVLDLKLCASAAAYLTELSMRCRLQCVCQFVCIASFGFDFQCVASPANNVGHVLHVLSGVSGNKTTLLWMKRCLWLKVWRAHLRRLSKGHCPCMCQPGASSPAFGACMQCFIIPRSCARWLCPRYFDYQTLQNLVSAYAGMHMS